MELRIGLLSQPINWLYSFSQASVNWPNWPGTTAVVATHPHCTQDPTLFKFFSNRGEEHRPRQSRGR